MFRTALRSSAIACWIVGLAVMTAAAQPRLPKPFPFPPSPDSPGVVTFDHETHLAVQEKPDCTSCHPKLFRILQPGRPADGSKIRHDLMQKGRQCAACHDSRAATGLDECEHCHKTAPADR